MADQSDESTLGEALELDPRAALRPEPFGALAYHYDTRRLIFLNDPALVSVVEALGHHDSIGATLDACGVAPERHGAFIAAIDRLLAAGVLRVRPR